MGFLSNMLRRHFPSFFVAEKPIEGEVIKPSDKEVPGSGGYREEADAATKVKKRKPLSAEHKAAISETLKKKSAARKAAAAKAVEEAKAVKVAKTVVKKTVKKAPVTPAKTPAKKSSTKKAPVKKPAKK